MADSEEEFEGTENETLRKTKKRTSRKEAWIAESKEIIDLIDPAAARNISSELVCFIEFVQFLTVLWYDNYEINFLLFSHTT